MGLGIARRLKEILPLSLYLGGLICGFRAMSGKTNWALMFIVFLLPLRNVVDRLQAFPGGTQFTDFLIFSLLVGWIVQTKQRSLFSPSAINLPAMLMPSYLLISLFLGNSYMGTEFSLNDGRVQDWKNFTLMPILFFVVANTVKDKKEVWRIFGVMAFVMFIVAYYTNDQVKWFSSLESRVKITGTFQFLGPNEVAAFFNSYVMIMLSVYFAMKHSRNKYLLLVVILVSMYCILFTYSRAAYAAFAAGLFLLFAIKNQKYIIPLVLAGLLWQTVLPEKAIERFKGTKNKYGELDESSQRRINIWETAMDLYQKNPVTGIGYGVFRNLDLDLGDTHNIYVKILVEQGMIGLALFLLAIFCFMREGLVLFRRGDDQMCRALGLGLFVCMFVLMINNFFGDRWSYLEPNSYLWVFGGLVSRLNNLGREPAATLAGPKKAPGIATAVIPPPPPVAGPSAPSAPAPAPLKKKKKIRYYDL